MSNREHEFEIRLTEIAKLPVAVTKTSGTGISKRTRLSIIVRFLPDGKKKITQESQ